MAGRAHRIARKWRGVRPQRTQYDHLEAESTVFLLTYAMLRHLTSSSNDLEVARAELVAGLVGATCDSPECTLHRSPRALRGFAAELRRVADAVEESVNEICDRIEGGKS